MLACLVSFANEYHVFHCHAVIKKNSYGLVIISRYGVLKTVRTRGPYMHMCICACAHCFHATATNPPWHCAINWRFSSWLSRIFGEIMDPCRHILSTMWTLDTYNVYLYKKRNYLGTIGICNRKSSAKLFRCFSTATASDSRTPRL